MYYSILAYFRYRKMAKTRHGVHSPFVYRFIEKVLRDRSPQPLLDKLSEFFDEDNVLILDEKYPGRWMDAYGELLRKMRSSTVIIVPKIHKSKYHTQGWNSLRNRSEVKMSIDLYRYGLLLYRDEFKEKQHFVLKYPY